MKKLGIVLLTLLSCGCSQFSDQDVQFVATNTTNNTAAAVINGREYTALANRSSRFTVNLQVRVNPYGNQTGPDPIDTYVNVIVAFRDTVTGKLTSPVNCQVRAANVNSIIYEMYSGVGYARCGY